MILFVWWIEKIIVYTQKVTNIFPNVVNKLSYTNLCFPNPKKIIQFMEDKLFLEFIMKGALVIGGFETDI